jgi:hypothetical protein
MLLLFMVFAAARSFGQHTYMDVAPSGRQDRLPVEGGSYDMSKLPQKPLDSLLPRLSSNWELIETGKGYWIGYTPDMFSIAAHGDSAIAPLLNLIDTVRNRKARIGAVYTLHLIGINRTIVGRFEEKFVDSAARNALLSLLKNPELQEKVMTLLMRDPWNTDVPKLIEVMMQSREDCWAVVSGLMHYRPQNPPVDRGLPDTLGHLFVTLKYSDPMSLERNFNFEGQMQELLDSIVNLHSGIIEVENSLFHQELWGNTRHKLGSQHLKLNRQPAAIPVSDYLDEISGKYNMMFAYTDLGNRLHYYVENGKVYLCSPVTAKKRWIAWWKATSNHN